MIKKSQIKEVLLKYIVPLQKQYPDFYLGGSLALILQKHIPARDVKDLDIISPVSFGDLHETKFPYRGMVTSKKTYHIREIKTCLDFFHNPKAKYITIKFQGHNIKLSPVNEIIHAKENKIWSPIYKQKQENLKQIIKEVFTEIKVQPDKIGLNSKIKKLDIILGKYNISGDEIGSKYLWTYAQEKLTPTTRNNAESFFSKLNITPTKISIGLVYRGELSNEEFNNLTDFEKINRLETERKAKSFYIEGNYQGTPIIIARKETRSPAAGQTNLFSPYAKLQFNKVKDLPANEILAALKIPNEGNIEEIKAQPGKTGLKDDRITIRQEKIFYDGPPDYDANIEYGTVVFGEGTDSKKWINTMYVYTPSKRKINFQPLGEPRDEKVAMLKQMLDNKNIPYTISALGSSVYTSIDVNNTDKYFIFKKDTSEIKVQPVNKLNKPVKKVKITDKPYIDIDTSFIEDYILDYGEIDENPLEIYLDNHEIFDTLIRESEYINFILNGDYGLYFNSNPQEIDNVLTLNDPLNIKDYAEEQAKFLSSGNPEDESFYKEEMIMAIETIQDNIPKYTAAKKILKDKFTIINNDEFSIILTTSNMHGKFLYTMILKQDGYFNKNGEIVLYTDPQT
jgi:hypothetical protein